jgi:hypothetical protein
MMNSVLMLTAKLEGLLKITMWSTHFALTLQSLLILNGTTVLEAFNFIVKLELPL